jgi:hypothetical protein
MFDVEVVVTPGGRDYTNCINAGGAGDPIDRRCELIVCPVG